MEVKKNEVQGVQEAREFQEWKAICLLPGMWESYLDDLQSRTKNPRYWAKVMNLLVWVAKAQNIEQFNEACQSGKFDFAFCYEVDKLLNKPEFFHDFFGNVRQAQKKRTNFSLQVKLRYFINHAHFKLIKKGEDVKLVSVTFDESNKLVAEINDLGLKDRYDVYSRCNISWELGNITRPYIFKV